MLESFRMAVNAEKQDVGRVTIALIGVFMMRM
jgi:hypothetical protein